MMRWSDTMGLEDPRSNGNVIAQVVLEQLGVPAGGRSGCGRRRRGGRSGPGVAVRSDRCTGGPSPAMSRALLSNAQAVTIAAQIAAAEASGRAVGRAPVAACVACRTPVLFVPSVRSLHRANFSMPNLP